MGRGMSRRGARFSFLRDLKINVMSQLCQGSSPPLFFFQIHNISFLTAVYNYRISSVVLSSTRLLQYSLFSTCHTQLPLPEYYSSHHQAHTIHT